MNVENSRAAIQALGGSADANRMPVYGGNNTTNQIYNNSKTSKVETHDTFNVYGNDAKSIADNISRNREQLITHNMQSASA